MNEWRSNEIRWELNEYISCIEELTVLRYFYFYLQVMQMVEYQTLPFSVDFCFVVFFLSFKSNILFMDRSFIYWVKVVWYNFPYLFHFVPLYHWRNQHSEKEKKKNFRRKREWLVLLKRPSYYHIAHCMYLPSLR